MAQSSLMLLTPPVWNGLIVDHSVIVMLLCFCSYKITDLLANDNSVLIEIFRVS